LYHLVLPPQTVTLYSVSGLIPTAASRCVFEKELAAGR